MTYSEKLTQLAAVIIAGNMDTANCRLLSEITEPRNIEAHVRGALIIAQEIICQAEVIAEEYDV